MDQSWFDMHLANALQQSINTKVAACVGLGAGSIPGRGAKFRTKGPSLRGITDFLIKKRPNPKEGGNPLALHVFSSQTATYASREVGRYTIANSHA